MARVDKQVKKLHSKELSLINVVWNDHSREEATWELETTCATSTPTYSKGKLEDELHFAYIVKGIIQIS